MIAIFLQNYEPDESNMYLNSLSQRSHTRFLATLLFLFTISAPTLEASSIKINSSQIIKAPNTDPFDFFSENLSKISAAAGDSVFTLCNQGTFVFGSESGLGGSDCWGWRDSAGNDYGIMGTIDGISFVNATTLQFIQTIPGPNQACGFYWRDIKTYGHYAYCVSECFGTNEGLMIIDMSYLPDSVQLVKTVDTGPIWGSVTSHNISIDTVQGYLYAEGNGFPNGDAVVILNLADPVNPAFVNSFGPSTGIHDLYAMNDTVYLAEGGSASFSIWDLSSKLSPQMLKRVFIPSEGYVHNIWPTDDGSHVVTTEEVPPGLTVKFWDIQNLDSVQLVAEYLGPSGLAHNAHVQDDTLYLSHYESGISILDISDPSNPVELTLFDTYVSNNPEYNGCWGIYPHTGNDLLYASNMDGVFFVLSKNFYLPGDTISAENSVAPAGSPVRVRIEATNSILIRAFTVAFSWAGTMNLIFDSVSSSGTRTETFEIIDLVGFDPFGKKAVYQLIGSNSDFYVGTEPGSGAILDLYFTIPNFPADTVNPIEFTALSGLSSSFVTLCQIDIDPVAVSGSITLGSLSCCDLAGDADGGGDVNIGDATFLVKYIFQGGQAPDCCDEADPDGGGDVNIGDANFIVKYVFQDGSEPLCPVPGDLDCQ